MTPLSTLFDADSAAAHEVCERIRELGFECRHYLSTAGIAIQVRVGRTNRSVSAVLPVDPNPGQLHSFVARLTSVAQECLADLERYEKLPDAETAAPEARPRHG